MTRWNIDLSPGAIRDLRRIKDRRLHKRLTDAMRDLGADPRPVGSLKLPGEVDHWRIRVRDWRIVYWVNEWVLVVTLAPGGGVYR